jgi:hypothetical protein
MSKPCKCRKWISKALVGYEQERKSGGAEIREQEAQGGQATTKQACCRRAWVVKTQKLIKNPGWDYACPQGVQSPEVV